MTCFYGFVGAHRVGKTTLAQRVADEMELPFAKTDVADTMKSLGLSSQEDLPFAVRLEVQELILQGLISGYAKAKTDHPHAPMILVDRTPLDVLGYTYSEVMRTTVRPDLMSQMARHDRLCIEATNFHFAGLCFVKVGLPLVSDPDKAPANPFYQRHVQAAMLDAVMRPEIESAIWLLHQRNLKIESRVSEAKEHLRATMNSHEAHNAAPSLVRPLHSLH